jgi:hypothetical protein
MSPGMEFQLSLDAYTNRSWIVEWSTNTSNWSQLGKFLQVTSPQEVPDPGATNSPHRIYRARLAP